MTPWGDTAPTALEAVLHGGGRGFSKPRPLFPFSSLEQLTTKDPSDAMRDVRHDGAPGGVSAVSVRTSALAVTTLLAVVSAVSAAQWFGAPVAVAAVGTGAMEIIHPGTTQHLASGGPTTEFGIALPQGAACPGDSAHDGYYVYSFLVPKGVLPASVSFKDQVPDKYFGLIAFGKYYYGADNTAENTGAIINVPGAFVWNRLTPEDLHLGSSATASWVAGVACAHGQGVVTNYWSADLVFSASHGDPNGFVWTVDHPASVVPGNGVPVGEILLIVGIVLILAGVVFALRQRRSGGAASGGSA